MTTGRRARAPGAGSGRAAGGPAPPTGEARRQVVGNRALRKLLPDRPVAGRGDHRAEREADAVADLVRSPPAGQRGVRHGVEAVLGVDLGSVRTDTSPAAASMARDLGARAFTIGADVHFGKGELQLGTAGGRRLLAHELAHVAQHAAAGASGRHDLHRDEQQGAGAAPRAATITLQLPNRPRHELVVATVADLYDAFDDLDSELFFAQRDAIPDSSDNPYWEAYQQHRDEVRTVGQAYAPYARDQGDQPVDPEEVRDFRSRVATAERIASRGHADYRRRWRSALQRARAAADAAREKSQNALRAAFLTGAEEAHPHVQYLWGVADKTQGIVTDLAGALAQEGTAVKELSTVTSRTFALVNLVSDWQTASPGTFGTALEGMGALRNAWSAGSTAAGFTSVPLGMFTGHIGPALEAIDKALGALAHRLREQNDDWVRFDGRPARPQVEPGGAPMWNYMVAVMHAGTAREVPVPRGGVYDYFDTFRKRFDQFNQGRARGADETPPASMPTERRWLVLTYADPERMPSWVFANRDLIWVSLYGSRPHEKARPL